MFKGIINKTKDYVERIIIKNNPLKKMYVADLMISPVFLGGCKPTATQLSIISRYIDINCKKNGLDYKYVYKLLPQNKIAEERQNFDVLLDSLDNYGLIDELSTIYVTQKKYISINHGTHRTGYALYKGIDWIPIKFLPKFRENWFPLDGIRYFEKNGYTQIEMRELLTTYEKVVLNLKHFYICIISKNYNKYFEDNQKLGKIISKKESPLIRRKGGKDSSVYREIRKIEKIKETCIYKINIQDQKLVKNRKEIKSEKAISLERQMKQRCGKGWGMISGSISDAIVLEIMLRDVYDIKFDD